jgi:hypothetical protein
LRWHPVEALGDQLDVDGAMYVVADNLPFIGCPGPESQNDDWESVEEDGDGSGATTINAAR